MNDMIDSGLDDMDSLHLQEMELIKGYLNIYNKQEFINGAENPFSSIKYIPFLNTSQIPIISVIPASIGIGC